MKNYSGEYPRRVAVLTGFALAMGYLESAVVVYLRELYYPGGFAFPFAPMGEAGRHLATTEIGREVATVVMLAGVGWLAGRTAVQRLAAFLYAFAVWDLAYYAFLKGLLGWPASLLTWDILFLVPLPWVGPVLAPVILSATMVGLAAGLVRPGRPDDAGIRPTTWLLLTIGSLTVVASFAMDFLRYASRGGASLTLAGVQSASRTFVPTHFDWLPFAAGEALLLWATWQVWRPVTTNHPPENKPTAPTHLDQQSDCFADHWNGL